MPTKVCNSPQLFTSGKSKYDGLCSVPIPVRSSSPKPNIEKLDGASRVCNKIRQKAVPERTPNIIEDTRVTN
ncbi:hypothetical protein MKW98_013881 [Papaver atlanticum]|uniref:Uncharacterized protein n=1 Tax=Papaver atlanticum TaxID=357466 RepID=A0AAD4SDP8_9MAGN|nr:hypothetical protein MKW98_013881 [Papaver atlanticum]